jgi:hypothetical protein
MSQREAYGRTRRRITIAPLENIDEFIATHCNGGQSRRRKFIATNRIVAAGTLNQHDRDVTAPPARIFSNARIVAAKPYRIRDAGW